MEFFVGLFVGLTWYYWLVLAVFFICLLGSSRPRSYSDISQRWGWSFVNLVAIVGLLLFVRRQYIFSHLDAGRVAALAVCWIVFGFVWGAIRWILFLRECKESFEKYALNFEKMNAKPSASDVKTYTLWRISRIRYIMEHVTYMMPQSSSRLAVNSYTEKELAKTSFTDEGCEILAKIIGDLKVSDVCPDPKQYKAEIGYDIVWWPLSCGWFILSDLPDRVYRAVASLVGNVYRRFNEVVFEKSML